MPIRNVESEIMKQGRITVTPPLFMHKGGAGDVLFVDMGALAGASGLAVARCTSSTADADGYYSAKLGEWDDTTDEWKDDTTFATVKLTGLNPGQKITSGERWQVTRLGSTDAGVALYTANKAFSVVRATGDPPTTTNVSSDYPVVGTLTMHPSASDPNFGGFTIYQTHPSHDGRLFPVLLAASTTRIGGVSVGEQRMLGDKYFQEEVSVLSRTVGLVPSENLIYISTTDLTATFFAQLNGVAGNFGHVKFTAAGGGDSVIEVRLHDPGSSCNFRMEHIGSAEHGRFVINDGVEGIGGLARYAIRDSFSSFTHEGESATTGGLTFVGGIYTGGAISVTVGEVADFVEGAQDAVGGILQDSDTVDFTYTDGGGGGTGSITAIVRYQMSITKDLNGIKLLNDETSPTAGKVYGTDGFGNKGWTYPLLEDGDYGDIVVSSNGTVLTIDTGVVTYAKIQDVAALSVVGRATSTDGVSGAISATNGSGAGVLVFGDTANTLAWLQSTDPGVLVSDGDAFSVLDAAWGSILFRGEDGWEVLTPGTDGQVLTTGGVDADPAWEDAAGVVEDGDYGDITVSSGGTVWNIDANAVGTTEIADDAVTTAKIADDAVTTAKILNANVTYAKIQNLDALSVFGRSANSSGVGASIAATNGSGAGVLAFNDTTNTVGWLQYGDVGILSTDGSSCSFQELSDLLDSAFGTGQGSLLHRGAGGWEALAPGGAGQVLTSNGAGNSLTWETP